MGFFTEDEVGSLHITNMILHVVGSDEFIAQPAREVEHELFFIDRIRDTDVAPVFAFEPASQTKSQLQRIADGSDLFEAGGQALSREFARFHGATSREGAFFIFEVGTNDPLTRIYSLIKYDYQEVIEQATGEEGNLLRLIVQAFVADKRAVQKSALIRTHSGIAEEAVSARDRMKQAPEIADYFAAFLHVIRARNDAQLNRTAVDVLRETLSQSRDVLPNQDVALAYRHAKEALRTRQQIDEDAIIEAVWAGAGNPDDERVRANLESRTRRKMRSKKLDGLAFQPDPQVLRRPALRRVRTTEGVTLTYPDEADGATVRRERIAAGGEVITIRTQEVTEDRVVADNPRDRP